MKRIKKLMSGLAFRMICGTVALLLLFNILSSAIGYGMFTRTMTEQYNDTAFHTAETAVSLVNGDLIDHFFETEGQTAYYRDKLRRMDILCEKMDVTLIYAIDVDQSDYGSFRCIFNSVHPDSSYSRWEIGYERETTNEEYREVYRQIYEEGLQQGTVIRTSDLRGKEAHITSLVPVTDSKGTVQAILCVQTPMEELVEVRADYLKGITRATVLLVVLAVLLVGIYLRKRYVLPVKKVIFEARRFSKESSRDPEVSLADISHIREIAELGEAIDKMETDMLRYMDNLTRITAERERINAELSLANSIQASMLPHTFPPFPDRKEFEIYASMTPAKEVGGDFYDFFLIDEDHLALVMADVSGKGIPAALFMMMSKILVGNYTLSGGTPAEVLKQVNDAISRGNENKMFVTVWLGIVTISTGEVVAANAGHEYPVIKKADGPFAIMKDRHGFVIGGKKNMKYRDYTFTLEPGDVLFVYTDGLPEAINEERQRLNMEGMMEILNRQADVSPQPLLKQVLEDVRQFSGKAEQFDDLTMMAFRRMM